MNIHLCRKRHHCTARVIRITPHWSNSSGIFPLRTSLLRMECVFWTNRWTTRGAETPRCAHTPRGRRGGWGMGYDMIWWRDGEGREGRGERGWDMMGYDGRRVMEGGKRGDVIRCDVIWYDGKIWMEGGRREGWMNGRWDEDNNTIIVIVNMIEIVLTVMNNNCYNHNNPFLNTFWILFTEIIFVIIIVKYFFIYLFIYLLFFLIYYFTKQKEYDPKEFPLENKIRLALKMRNKKEIYEVCQNNICLFFIV